MRKGEPAWNKGKKLDRSKYPNMGHLKLHSIEAKEKMSKKLKGHSGFFKGKTFTLQHRKKLSISHIGKTGTRSSNWRGGITPENYKIRTSREYKLWREAVFKRDNWTCIWCWQRGGELNADHIKPFSLFPELRFAIDNGRTLCLPCHKTTDSYGGRVKKYNAFTRSTAKDR